MIDFRELTLEDKQWLDPLFLQNGFGGSEYSAANLFNWRRINGTRVARWQGFALLVTEKWGWSYLFPAGEGDLAGAVDAMAEDARQRGKPFEIHGIPEGKSQVLEQLFPGRFAFEEQADYFDYIYTREKLMTLAGKKLHAKRNHIARFKENFPDWSYEPITRENMPEVRRMSQEWCRQNDCQGDPDKRDELCSVQMAMDHFEQEGLRGGLLRAGGRVVAFSMGEPLTRDTFVVHIEKAFADVQGAYPMINQQFVTWAMEGFAFVNREDDAGSEGLRRAKMSYQPDRLYRRWKARQRDA